MTSITRISILGLAALATLAMAADGVILKRVVKADDEHKYKMAGTFDTGGQGDATVTATVTEKILKVDDNGDYTVQRAQGSMHVAFGGQEMDVDSGTPKVSVFHPDGTLVEMRGEGLDSSSYRLANLAMLRFPANEVKIGDTWSADSAADAKTGAVKASAKFTLAGEEKVGDVDTWKITAKVTELEGDTPASSDSTIWLSKTDLLMIKEESAWTNAPVNPAPMPVSGKVTLTLVP